MSNGDRAEPTGAREWILVGMDFSPASRHALARARAMAAERDASLLVLHVIDGHGIDEVARIAEIPESRLRERLTEERRLRLDALMLEAREADGSDVPVKLLISWGRPFEEILKKASDFLVDLIVMGTSGHSADLEKALFGSTAEKVLRATPCPVLCVPAD